MKPVACLLVIAASAFSLAAAAQEQRTREGFGSSYGPSLVGGPIHCDDCSGESFAGAGGYLRLGRYFRPDLFVGVEASLHTLPLGYNRFDAKSLSGTLQWYPAARNGFYIKGTLGVARLVYRDNEDEDTRRYTLTAPTLGMGIGYDIRTRFRFLLTPFAGVTRTASADYKRNGETRGSASTTAVQVGLGFTWY
jgi:opacity protein-like surface antigen